MPGAKNVIITVPGDPVPKARPRVDHHRAHTPKRTKAFETHVRAAYLEQIETRSIDGPVFADIRFYFSIPKSWKKEKRLKAQQGLIKPTGRNIGDIDNLVKAVLDGLNGYAYEDDSSVVTVTARKLYSEEPKTVIQSGMNEESAKCALCKEEFMKRDMFEVFTGRTQYICLKCHKAGDREIFRKRQIFRNSQKGKQIIEHAQKKK